MSIVALCAGRVDGNGRWAIIPPTPFVHMLDETVIMPKGRPTSASYFKRPANSLVRMSRDAVLWLRSPNTLVPELSWFYLQQSTPKLTRNINHAASHGATIKYRAALLQMNAICSASLKFDTRAQWLVPSSALSCPLTNGIPLNPCIGCIIACGLCFLPQVSGYSPTSLKISTGMSFHISQVSQNHDS